MTMQIYLVSDEDEFLCTLSMTAVPRVGDHLRVELEDEPRLPGEDFVVMEVCHTIRKDGTHQISVRVKIDA